MFSSQERAEQSAAGSSLNWSMQVIEVVGTHNSPASAERLRALGAKPVMLDLLDAGAVRQAVLESEPEAIVHEATALANAKFSRNFDKTGARDQRAANDGHRSAAGGRA